MSFRRSFRIGLITEVLNNRLDSSVIEANNHWRKIEIGQEREDGLSMISI